MGSRTNLQSLYSAAAAQLATSPEENEEDDPARRRSVFHPGSVPAPPDDLFTNGVVVRRGTNFYPSLAVDATHIFGAPDAFRCLGLWIVACLMEPGARTFELRLDHAESEVRRFRIDTRYRLLDGERAGLHTEPRGAVYYPGRLAACPLAGHPAPLPRLQLTDHEGWAGYGDDDLRDVLWGFGSDQGAWLFAELLLNLSQSWNPRREVALEGPFGFGGAAPGGAEVLLRLSGGSGRTSAGDADPD